MKESKFIRELFAEEFEELRRKAITEVLEARFGEGAANTASPLLAGITDERRLTSLLRLAGTCKSLEEFQEARNQT